MEASQLPGGNGLCEAGGGSSSGNHSGGTEKASQDKSVSDALPEGEWGLRVLHFYSCPMCRRQLRAATQSVHTQQSAVAQQQPFSTHLRTPNPNPPRTTTKKATTRADNCSQHTRDCLWKAVMQHVARR